MSPTPESPTVLVIGAGAAGLMASIAAAEHGARTILLERNPEPGIKVLMSGGGRCNITNTGDTRHLVASFPGNGRFLYSAFSAFSNEAVVRLLESEGIATQVEDRGRVFPASGRAREVVDAFTRRVRRAGVELVAATRVTSVTQLKDGGFQVTGRRVQGRGRTAQEAGPEQTWTADRLIICTGGVSYPTSGSTGDGYTWARQFGHQVVQPQPAIVGLETREGWPARVRGVPLRDVTLLVRAGGKSYGEFRGDVLFTHFGLSGPAALNASHQAVVALTEQRPTARAGAEPALTAGGAAGGNTERAAGSAAGVAPRVELAIRPEEAATLPTWEERLKEEFAEHPRQLLKNILARWWPASLTEVVLSVSGLPGNREAAHVTRSERAQAAALLHELVLTLKGPRPIGEAMVTAGGVDVREVNPKTMGSRLVTGLYLAGEVLDVDGISGGYNLQGAYSTGWLAGRSAALGEQ